VLTSATSRGRGIISVMTRRRHRLVFAVLAAAMFVLHVDPWSSGAIEPVTWGFVPRDLGYHIVWIIAAVLLTFYLCGPVWRETE
jgi:hypothetical protein